MSLALEIIPPAPAIVFMFFPENQKGIRRCFKDQDWESLLEATASSSDMLVAFIPSGEKIR